MFNKLFLVFTIKFYWSTEKLFLRERKLNKLGQTNKNKFGVMVVERADGKT